MVFRKIGVLKIWKKVLKYLCEEAHSYSCQGLQLSTLTQNELLYMYFETKKTGLNTI